MTFEDSAERNKALGLYGAVAGLSASIGVIASGLLTDGPGWRWVFLINVPVGVLLIAGAATFLPIDVRDRERSKGFDVAGAVTVTAGLLLLIYGVNRAADVGWETTSTVGLLIGSVVMLSAFVVIEMRSSSPLVPGESVRNRTLAAANLSASDSRCWPSLHCCSRGLGRGRASPPISCPHWCWPAWPAE